MANLKVYPTQRTSGFSKSIYKVKTNFNTNEILNKAQDQWSWILETLGVDVFFLKNKHGPCPFCGGKDCFRFDDKDGKGSFYCNQCGPGFGLQFVMRYCNCLFSEALKKVARVLSLNHDNSVKPTLSYNDTDFSSKTKYILENCISANGEHPYLGRKQIQLKNLSTYKDSLIVKVFTGHMSLLSLQLIRPDCQKIFLKGTPTKGAYSVIGQHNEENPLILAEGFATGASLYQSLGIATFISFSCGNLKDALKNILNNFNFNGQIFIAGDNDKNQNGFSYAKDALQSLNVQGYIVMPETVGTDWNDVFVTHGKDAVILAFKEVLA